MKMLPFILILFLPFTSSSSTVKRNNNTDYLIAFGIPKSTTSTSQDGRTWESDDNPIFAPLNINKISSSAVINGVNNNNAPFTSARIFNSPVTYSFPIINPGPKFLRLYFTNTVISFNNTTTTTTIPASELFLSVEANGFSLLYNFSMYLNSQDPNSLTQEFHLTIQKGNPLNLTFSTTSRYGFINGIEITSVPNGLYLNSTRPPPPMVTYGSVYSFQQHLTAFQMAYRINVGGSTISPLDDSGGLRRKWLQDNDYIVGNFFGQTVYTDQTTVSNNPPFAYGVIYSPEFPSYVAPKLVYGTVRVTGLSDPQSLTKFLTWRFDVDPGFDYMVRLHFCEMDNRVNATHERVFKVYLNNETAGTTVDVFEMSGGSKHAMFRDYVVSFTGESHDGIKVPLWLSLHPVKDTDSRLIDPLLNGVEILKLNQPNGNLAVSNPPPPANPSPPSAHIRSSKHHHILLIIIAAICLASLLLITCLIVYKFRVNKNNKNKNKNMDTTNTENKNKWAPISFDLGSTTTTSTVSSSLPSDICRHFTFTQIRIATRDFDEDLVIGMGGFGKVYKGSIDGGATKVAVKRLNSTSKQGVREFQTEIEMLSRLRHLHLVSLIGYCDEECEMILIYEYMPRGTLRDHLFYKISEDFDTTNINPLSWKQRLKICLGSARGLHYLHTGAKHLIIHRDVKSTNILLDDKWTAKVSDFGLSKVGPDHNNQSGSTHVSTGVKGSAGYLDPEYYRRNQLTEKSDVYSFGVVLFEVLCARAAIDPKLPKEEANLAMWARSRYKKGILHTIMDPNLTGQIAPESLRKFGEIADLCVRDRGNERPSMGDVVWGLEFALQLQESAENEHIANGTPDESFDLSSNYLSAMDIGFTDNDASNNSTDNFSLIIEGASNKLTDSKSTITSSSDYYHVDAKSGSVFSEIADPKAR